MHIHLTRTSPNGVTERGQMWCPSGPPKWSKVGHKQVPLDSSLYLHTLDTRTPGVLMLLPVNPPAPPKPLNIGFWGVLGYQILTLLDPHLEVHSVSISGPLLGDIWRGTWEVPRPLGRPTEGIWGPYPSDTPPDPSQIPLRIGVRYGQYWDPKWVSKMVHFWVPYVWLSASFGVFRVLGRCCPTQTPRNN